MSRARISPGSSRCPYSSITGSKRRPGPANAGPGRLVFGAAAEVAGQEPLGGGVEAQPVLRLGEAVALVGEQQVLVVDPSLDQRGDDLLRLGLLDPRVVGALGDQQRNADV